VFGVVGGGARSIEERGGLVEQPRSRALPRHRPLGPPLRDVGKGKKLEGGGKRGIGVGSVLRRQG
jgi:hypothetical protein